MKISMQMVESWQVGCRKPLQTNPIKQKTRLSAGFKFKLRREGEFSGGLLFSRKDKTI